MRKLVPISQLTPEMVDRVRATVETRLLTEAGRKGYKVSGTPEEREVVIVDLLPYSDLGIAGGGNFDYWQTTALVADTEEDYVSHKLDDDEWVAIYGVAINDTDPSTRKVECLVGSAIILADWQLEEIFCDDKPIGITEEYALWLAGDTVTVKILPQDTKAAGDHLVLIGLMCQPKGKRITK